MKIKSLKLIFAVSIVFFLGLIMFFAGLEAVIQNMEIKNNTIETKANIINIVDGRDFNGEKTQIPDVEYFVNDQRYIATLNCYQMGMYVGKQVSVYYNLENPDTILMSEGNITSANMKFVFGIFMILPTGIYLLFRIKKCFYKKNSSGIPVFKRSNAKLVTSLMMIFFGTAFLVLEIFILKNKMVDNFISFEKGDFCLIITGLFFLSAGLYAIIVDIIRSNNKRKLILTGTKIEATFDEVIVKEIQRPRLDSMKIYVISCRWENPIDGEIYFFKSFELWEDPREIINAKKITSFPVYINENNKKQYFLEIDKLYEIENDAVEIK